MEENIKIRIREELEVAKTRLKAAKLLFEKGMLENAVNRAYYSFFHARQSHAQRPEIRRKNPFKLNIRVWLKNNKNKPTRQKIRKILQKSLEMRESSDYEIGIIFGEEEV
jgi:uncharacterized protein (UPF0332 family)